MQLHDILQLRTSVILPEAISDGGLAPTTDTSLFLTTYRGGSHLPSDISKHIFYGLRNKNHEYLSLPPIPSDFSVVFIQF